VRKHIALALVVSSAGFSIAVAFSLLGTPDVALVAVLVETIVTLILLGVLRLMPRNVLQNGARLAVTHQRLRALVGVVAGVFALVLTWGALSQSPSGPPVVREIVQLAPEAHAKDVVTVVLADFRALDTMGEITVVALVLLGVATLVGRGRLP
jgi:multicomponent Na+:H+ antiporter subunit A